MYLRETGWDSVDFVYVPEDRCKLLVLENTNEHLGDVKCR
jgi:hypothetical protein